MGATFKEFLAAMALLKEALGEEIYYGILKSAGYEHANKIMNRPEQQKVYGELLKTFQGLEEETPPSEPEQQPLV